MDNRSILYGMPMKPAHVDVDLEKSFASFLRDKGYLVIPPGDTSPVAELVRAATVWDKDTFSWDDLADAVAEDPAVRRWAERGRK